MSLEQDFKEEQLACWNVQSYHLLLPLRSVLKSKSDFIAAEDDVPVGAEALWMEK